MHTWPPVRIRQRLGQLGPLSTRTLRLLRAGGVCGTYLRRYLACRLVSSRFGSSPSLPLHLRQKYRQWSMRRAGRAENRSLRRVEPPRGNENQDRAVCTMAARSNEPALLSTSALMISVLAGAHRCMPAMRVAKQHDFGCPAESHRSAGYKESRSMICVPHGQVYRST